jgi:hypothetical protein
MSQETQSTQQLQKQKSHAFGKDVYLLGTINGRYNMKLLTAQEFNIGCTFYKTLESDHLFTKELQIYKEHGIYHVRVFKKVRNSTSCDLLSWDTFDTLTEVKKHLKGQVT